LNSSGGVVTARTYEVLFSHSLGWDELSLPESLAANSFPEERGDEMRTNHYVRPWWHLSAIHYQSGKNVGNPIYVSRSSMILKKNDAKNRQDSDDRSDSRSSCGGTPGLPGRSILDLRAGSYVLFNIDNDIPDKYTNKQLEQSISAMRGPASGQRNAIPMGWSASRRAHAAGWLVRPASE
jgi:hypothetical protein